METAVIAGVRGRLIGEPEPVTLVLPADGHVEPFRAGMAALPNASANTNAVGAADYLYTTILRQLVPDEPRILAALADGHPRPAVATRTDPDGTILPPGASTFHVSETVYWKSYDSHVNAFCYFGTMDDLDGKPSSSASALVS